MAKRNSLTNSEVSIIKKLLDMGQHTNQEIAGLINRLRGDASNDVSSGRITNIKQDEIQKYVPVPPASDEEVAFFFRKLEAFDPQTGLNFFDDERLIRAREAMILAVQVFNSSALKFKTEVFAMLANVAWTYLLHEYYYRKGEKITDRNGKTVELSKLLRRKDCPLSKGIKQNLRDLKEIRDAVEHRLFGKSDGKWLSLFQACCLNFDKTLCDLYSEKLSLQNDLAFALQFAKLNVEQITTVQGYDIPKYIEALDARLNKSLDEDDLKNLEYRFRVIYTLDSGSKSNSHMKFVNPDSAEGKEIRNVLVKHKLGDELYPHKPNVICQIITNETGYKFTLHNHTQAWRKFKVRPQKGADNPEQTNMEYCLYHSAHNDYTYSDKWLEKLIDLVKNPIEFEKLKKIKI